MFLWAFREPSLTWPWFTGVSRFWTTTLINSFFIILLSRPELTAVPFWTHRPILLFYEPSRRLKKWETPAGGYEVHMSGFQHLFNSIAFLQRQYWAVVWFNALTIVPHLKKTTTVLVFLCETFHLLIVTYRPITRTFLMQIFLQNFHIF